MRPRLRDTAIHDSATVEKVERLLEILSEIDRDSFLRERLVLHGGTALNLFGQAMPRLSVDIDLLYAGSPDREVMVVERPATEEGIRRIARAFRYQVGTVRAEVDEHAGRTFRLSYRSDAGPNGQIKIDTIFLDRIPLLGASEGVCVFGDPPVRFRCVQPSELLARKVKALVERRRPAVRDLFDVARWGDVERPDEPLFRALVTYFFALSRPFPTRLRRLCSDALGRFGDVDRAVQTDLVPMLAAGEAVDADGLIARTAAFLDDWGELTADHEEYLRRLDEENRSSPELLFADWPDVLARAGPDPVMKRKLDNLRGRAE